MTRYRHAISLFWLAVVLSGCASTAPAPEPMIVTQSVDKPVAVSCVPGNLGAAPGTVDLKTGLKVPDYADTRAALLAAPDAAGRYKLLVIGRKQRMDRLSQVEPVIDGCGDR